MNKKFLSFILATVVTLTTFFSLSSIGLNAATQTYTLTADDVEYVDNGGAGIRIEGLSATFATDHPDLPAGNWTMVIPNEIDGKTVTELAPGTNGFNSTANRIAFEENCTITKAYAKTFANCSSLKYFEFPKSMTDLGTFLFQGNTMNSITFDDNYTVTTFDMMVFGSATTSPFTVQAVKMPENIRALKSYSSGSYNQNYTGTFIETIDYGVNSQLEIAPEYASNWIGISNCYNIPAKITTLNQGAFFSSQTSNLGEKLKKVTFAPDSQLKTIGKYCFRWCQNITSIELPLTVTRIETDAFSGCSSLSYIGGLDNVEYIGTGAFGSVRTSKLSFPNIKTLEGGQTFRSDYIKEVEFGGTLQSIPSECFAYAYNLEKVTLPQSVTVIGKDAFCQAGSYKDTLVIEGAENVKRIYSGVFSGSGLVEISELNNLEELYSSAFSNCSIRNIVLGGTITEIPSKCFYDCRNLSSVTISENITRIKNNAFERTGNFTINNESIDYIEDEAFLDSDITKYNFNNHEKFIGHSVFEKSNLVSVIYTTSPDIDYVPGDCFYECSYLKNIILSDNIKHINDYALGKTTNLSSIELPDTLKTIGKYAFSGSYINSITIPNSVVDIGENAFKSCTSLKEVNIDRFASWSLDSSENTATIVGGAEGGYAFSGTAITEIRYPETIGVLPALDANKVKKIYIQGPNVVGLAGNNIKPATGQSARVYFDEETKLRPAATSQVSQWKNFNAIFCNGETYEYLKTTAGLTNVYKRDTSIDLEITSSGDDITLTATLTADGAPDNRIAIYYEDMQGRRVEVATQACSTGKVLTQTISNANLPVGNLKYIAVYEPTDPDAWYACEDIEYFDKGVANCSFGAITQSFSATGDLILDTPVICDTEAPRGTVKVYLGENAGGTLLHTYDVSVGKCSIAKSDLPYGDNTIFIEFIPADVGMSYCNTSTTYNKPAITTTLNATVTEYNNTLLVNTNVTPGDALSEGEVYIYLGDEVTGVRMNEPNTLYTYIPSSRIKAGDNTITVVYQSPDGHYKTSKQVLNYNFDGGEPTLRFNISTEYGFVYFSAILENYEPDCKGTIRIYKGYDNTGELIYGGSAPMTSTKFNLAQFNDYGNQTYYAEYISSNMDNKDANALCSYSRESKASSIVGEVTTTSDTTVRVSAYAVDGNKRPITKGQISIYRGSSSAGVLVKQADCDGNPIAENLDRDSFQVGINEFFIVYYDGTEEYATSTMSIVYTRLSSTEGGTDLDNIYNSYEEQLRALILQIEENNIAWQRRFDELEALISGGADLSELNAKIESLEEDIAELNLKLGEIDELKSLINSLKNDIKNINVGGNTGGTIDIDMDDFKKIVDKGLKNQLTEIEKLLEKFENGKDTEFSLSERDLEKIREFIDGKDFSKEIAILRNEIQNVSEKIDKIKMPEVQNPVSVDNSSAYGDLYNKLVKNQNSDKDDFYNKIKSLLEDENAKLKNELVVVKNNLDAESSKYDKLAKQIEEMKDMQGKNNFPDWLKILFVILVVVLISGLVYVTVMIKKMNTLKEQLKEQEKQIDILNNNPQEEADRLNSLYDNNNPNNYRQ